MVPRYIARAILSYASWRAARRVRRRMPGLAALMGQRDARKRQHKPTAAIDATIRQMVTERLRVELGVQHG